MATPQKKTPQLSLGRLCELLSYNRWTGVFRWRIYRNQLAPAGGIAGSPNSEGYCQIKIDGVLYVASRLAWFYVHGKWPVALIDHRNGDRANDRLKNLREATHSQNRANSRANTGHGLKGAYRQGQCNSWVARIKSGGKVRYLGSFRTEREAHDAYCAVASNYHGEFARLR